MQSKRKFGVLNPIQRPQNGAKHSPHSGHYAKSHGTGSRVAKSDCFTDLWSFLKNRCRWCHLNPGRGSSEEFFCTIYHSQIFHGCREISKPKSEVALQWNTFSWKINFLRIASVCLCDTNGSRQRLQEENSSSFVAQIGSTLKPLCICLRLT